MEKADLKRRAVQYYNEKQVPKQLETLLNTMFLDEPQDTFGYMAEYFNKLSKPISIADISVEPTLSNSGYDTLKTGISCIVNGIKKDIFSLEFFKDGRPLQYNKAHVQASRLSAKQGGKKDSKGGSKGANKKETVQAVEEVSRTAPLVPKCTSLNRDRASMFLVESFIPRLIGSTLDEDDLDERLRSCCKELKDHLKQQHEDLTSPQQSQENIEHQKEDPVIAVTSPISNQELSASQASIITPSPKSLLESETEINMSSFFMSLVTAMCRCQLAGDSLYQGMITNKTECEKRCPMPAMSFFTSDQTSPGKLCMIKELLVLPKPTQHLKKGVEDLVRLYRSFENALSSKFAANGMVRNDRGVLTPALDKLEQIFELLVQACKMEFECEFTDLFDVILNVGATDLYDADKKKYEVCTGMLKSSEEIISLYNGWIQTFSIIALIDPLSQMDVTGLSSIYEELAPHCYIITTQFTNFDHVSTSINEKQCDGILLQPELYCQTLSETQSNLKLLQDAGGVFMMSDEWCLVQNSSVAVDMAFALDANFLRISPPILGGAVNLRRFLEIYEKEVANRRTQSEDYEFRGEVKIEEGDDDNNVEEGELVEGER